MFKKYFKLFLASAIFLFSFESIAQEKTQVNADLKIANAIKEIENKEELVEVYIYFNKNVNREDALATLVLYNITPLEDPLSITYEAVYRFLAKIPVSKVYQIARDQKVYQIWIANRNIVSYALAQAQMSRVVTLWPSQTSEFRLDGEGITMSYLDDTAPRTTHEQFEVGKSGQSRLSIGTAFYLSGQTTTHATAVAGVLIGDGEGRATSTFYTPNDAKGIAPKAELVFYDQNYDPFGTMVWVRDSRRLYICNNSWSLGAGWYGYRYDQRSTLLRVWNGHSSYYDEKFGKYTDSSALVDSIVFNSNEDKLLLVFAAGNSRGEGLGHRQRHFHGKSDQTLYTDDHIRWNDENQRGDAARGYDTFDTFACSKNGFIIGDVDDQRQITRYSSWGPCDDYRMKPDLVALGGRYLADAVADNEYFLFSGTSFSAPVVTGITALLQQYFNKKGYFTPTAPASMLKALLIHSAVDLGQPGPDYKYGWGLVNAEDAVKIIRDDNLAGRNKNILYRTFRPGFSTSIGFWFDVTLQTGSDFKATLVWTDPPGDPNLMGIDDSSPSLKHDLDIRVITAPVGPSSQRYYPFTFGHPLTGNLVPIGSNAVTGDNTVDNVEQIVVKNLPPGSYYLEVSYKTPVLITDQSFTIISSHALRQ